ncbi:alpha/beta hydrolase [Candidatus Nomurabacteria bacterium]|nr:alpha/beta hydrolase [Candidatus Nomurabacteria bacterium]
MVTKLADLENLENLSRDKVEALKKFIIEKGIKKLTLVGYSQGGDQAIDLAGEIQDEVDVEGVVLVDSTGLYQQDEFKMSKDFVSDAALGTGASVMSQLYRANYSKKQRLMMVAKGAGALVDIVGGVFRDMKKFKSAYPKKLRQEISEMSSANANLAKLKVPVVIISGESDPISKPDKIVPPEEERRFVEEGLSRDDFFDPREEYLKKNLLPNSPYVRMIIGKNMGHHSLPFFRPESIAKVGLYALERYHRKLKTE